MEETLLRQICEDGCSVTGLSVNVYRSATIAKHTVRRKGQYAVQRLFYIVGGMTKFVLDDGEEIVCTKGDVVYLPPDVTYVSVWEDCEENAAILVQFDLLSNNTAVFLSNSLSIIGHDSRGTLFTLFSNLAEHFRTGSIGYKIKCQSLLLEILYSLITEHLQAPARHRNHAVYRGVLYIENHYLEPIDVNAIAAMCSLCPSAFRSHFRAVTGMSPIQYKNQLTMKRAAELLQTGTLSISEVAHTLDIQDIYYFNRLFKKVYRVPPGRFYKENQKQ